MYTNEIYPAELTLNKANTNHEQGPFLFLILISTSVTGSLIPKFNNYNTYYIYKIIGLIEV